ncbi:uracil-DNA glycosylase [Paenibacillus chondroitinus]|uniref:Uracil-DNA glycosylase n=1 Tax=Paenibacillus chondroitinus TaxID=59842 RepID=A0ABU6DNA9_9BACL|nr:uracil-DNA glycosylase [Paenibacillus chondroitinus]MCY9662056.1 uracil-DNA glycosylase [Paenibacillus anseongense]MEB4798272.1 uracil-DNA glycosylase [Paenibacillus chondroitinus]
MFDLTNDWAKVVGSEFEEPYFQALCDFLNEEYRVTTIYPEQNEVLNALQLTSYEATKVVILGQDPYHGRGQAHGLSFSVKPGITPPPSLQNMYKELQSDLGCFIPNNGYLVNWAKQGVLLLNTVLTVREDTPNSHKGKGWERFTDKVIEALNSREQPVIFVLWGSHAQAKERLIHTNRHFILKSVHPSPLSSYRGFFGSKPFSQVNKLLKELGSQEINWQIPNL